MVDENKESTRNTWGRVALLRGAIGGAMSLLLDFGNLYDRFYPDKPIIKAVGRSYPIELPAKQLPSDEVLAKRLANEAAYPFLAATGKDAGLIARQAAQLVKQEVTRALQENAYTGYWTFEIQNIGQQAATDIRLGLPFDGQYEIVKSGAPLAAFKETILLGELHPSATATVRVWTTGGAMYLPTQSYPVTYKEGSTTALFPFKTEREGTWSDWFKQEGRSMILIIVVYASVQSFLFGWRRRIEIDKQEAAQAKHDALVQRLNDNKQRLDETTKQLDLVLKKGRTAQP